MKYPREALENIYRQLQTCPDKGLSAGRAAELQNEIGFNKFDEEKKETVWRKVWHHLKDFSSLILIVAAGISLVLAIMEDHGFAEPIVILSIVVINIILAVRQEMDAERALEALKNMHARMTVVIRDGVRQPLDAVQLVPGDILMLETGDMIPADARIIECVNLKVEESALTGESVSVEKDAGAAVGEKVPIGDQVNMLFSGCLITNGRAKAVVVETGMRTEMGKIAGLLNDTKKVRTPLQKRLVRLGKVLTVVALASAAVLFTLEFLHGQKLLDILMNAVALAVAAVPETLMVIATITLAYGVRVMARKKAIIRKIAAVEALGCATVICSDKTGTLTQNRMCIQRVWAVSHPPKNAGEEFNHDERMLIEMMGLASNASINIHTGAAIGDPTETAIVRLLRDKHIEKESLDAIFPKVFEIPFDSGRKLMTTVHELEDMRYLSITKGAFDRIPVDATSICADSPNPLDTAGRIHDEFAHEALRVIACAYKYYDKLPEKLDSEELEHGLTFAGFVGMIDPPRPESAEAVQTAKEAGIKTVMITGDHAVTASAIAREIGILSDTDKTITGAELAELPEEYLAENIRDYAVYARVSPEDKIRIVKAWQSRREVVAMTGDGVNDAPALKAADAGIAMGSGTDVSKNASDIILTDDNFAAIVDAVREGRRVYDNIKKAFFSLLSDNVSEIIAILFAVICRWGMPFVAVQLLYINVVADGAPNLFFCKEPAESDIMRRKPVDKHGSLFADGLGRRIGLMAAVLAVITLTGFYLGKYVMPPAGVDPHKAGQTMAFVINACSSVINSFNIRSYKQSLFTVGLGSNWWLSGGIFFSVGLTAAVATLPFVSDVFHCVPLSLNHWLIIAGLVVVPLIVGEIHKIFLRKRDKKR